MTEEIKYNKDEKWIPYKQLAETPQQTIARLEQENNSLQAQLNNRTVQSNNAITALEQENKELKENQCHFSTCEHIDAEIARYAKLSESFLNYRSALEEIREDIRSFYGCEDSSNDYKLVNMIDKINEVLQNEQI